MYFPYPSIIVLLSYKTWDILQGEGSKKQNENHARCCLGFFSYTWNVLSSIRHVCVISLSAAWAVAGTLRILVLFRRKQSKSTGSSTKGSLWAQHVGPKHQKAVGTLPWKGLHTPNARLVDEIWLRALISVRIKEMENKLCGRLMCN